jgi:hypothetical protein
MIQRIQSLYLLLTTALLIAVLFIPFGVFQTSYGVCEYTAFSIAGIAGKSALPLWSLPLLILLSSTLAFSTIFLYKKRSLQIRVSLINSLLISILSMGAAGILFMVKSDIFLAEFKIGVGFALPILALLFNFLAIKAIKKDEKLVKSWDRIR